MSMNFDEMVEAPEKTAPGKRGLELRRPPVVVVGGLPTVSLLPRELLAAARGKAIKRAFVAGVVVAVAIAAGSTAGAAALAGAAQSRLEDSNATTQQLVTQLAKFRDVQALQQGIAVGEAAVEVGTSTEVDWQAQVQAIEGLMPSDWSVTSITGDSASPMMNYAQGTSPLERPRAASMLMTVSTQDISGVGPWLRKLRSLKAYADATASVISNESSSYTVQLTLHLSPKAIQSAGKASK